MPQCSFAIHKGPLSSESKSTNSYLTENVQLLSSNLDSEKDTMLDLHSVALRNSSPRSIVVQETPDIKLKESRYISPLQKRNPTPNVRRSNSFDDSFCHLSSTTTTTDATKTIVAPIRAGKRKERFQRCSSLPCKPKRNVTFDDKYDKIHEIERLSDIPTDVIVDLWWTSEDYQGIKREYEAIIYLLDQNMTIDEQHDSARGLHNRTEFGAWELYEKQRNARNAVLRQQDLHRKQKQKGNSNSTTAVVMESDMSIDAMIAKAYMDETLPLREDALQLAKKDYEIATSFYISSLGGAIEESLEDSISDLSMLVMDDKEASEPAAVAANVSSNRNSSDRSIQSLRRTRSDNFFVDSMLNNDTKPKRNNLAPSRSRSTQSHDKLFDRSSKTTLNLSSVFEESTQFMSDEDQEGDEVVSEGKTQSDDDARSTDTTAKPDQHDHVATKVTFAKKTQKIKRVKVKDIESDTKKRWYSKAELIEIASDVNNMVETIEKEGHVMNGELTTEKHHGETRRGLEKSTEVGARKLYDRRRQALNVVLSTQLNLRQNEYGQDKESIESRTIAIAEAYIAATKEAYQEAIKFGKQDAKEARKHRIKRRSCTPDPISSDKRAIDSMPRISSRRTSQSRDKDDEDDVSEASGNKELSILPPLERSLSVSSNDSTRSLLCVDAYATEDVNDYSMRSILILETEGDETSTMDAENFDMVGSSRDIGHHLSESHAPSRRFAAQSLNRHAKMLEAKQQASTLFGSQRQLKGTTLKTKKFHNNPYDTSSTRDDSTTNDGSQGNDTLLPIQETTVGSALDKTPVEASHTVSEESTSSKDKIETNDSTAKAFVWFKVNTADVQEMTLANGTLVYVLRNTVKCDNHSDCS